MIAPPWYDLSKRHRRFAWSSDQEIAFQVLKEKLITATFIASRIAEMNEMNMF
jgi:hypothetical protein